MKPEGGRFDEETYARARRFVESGGKRDEEESPKPKAKPAAKRVAKPRADAAPAVPGRPRGEGPGPSSTGIRRNPLGEMFAGEETRKQLRSEPDVSKEEVAAAKAAGDARRAKIAAQDKEHSKGLGSWLKRTFGTKAMREEEGYKKGGSVKKYAKGGSVRGDGICRQGKTKGTMR